MRLHRKLSIILSFILISSDLLHAQGNFKKQGGAGGGGFICNANGAVWNQRRPCDENTPERELMLKRLGTRGDGERKSTIDLSVLESKPVDAALGQVINFPDRFLAQDIRLKDLSMWGKISRDAATGLKPGFQSTAVLSDKHKRSLMIAIADQVGMNLSSELNPGLKYPLEYALINVEHSEQGFVAYLKKYSFSDDAAQKISASDLAPSSPVFEYGKSARSSGADSAEPPEFGGDTDQGITAPHASSGSEQVAAPADNSMLNKLLESLSSSKAQEDSPTSAKSHSQPQERKLGDIEFQYE